jgi:hypothetical protein
MTVAESTALTAAIPSPRTPLASETPGGAVPAVGTRGPARARRRARWLLGSALGASFAATCAMVGLPTDRVVLLGWVVAGLGLYAVADGPRRVGRLLADWLPLVALLLAYDASRGLADGFGATVHVGELADADRWLAGGSLPTVVLQQYWQADWWKALASLVYASHFVVTPVLLGVLWIRDRDRWKTFAGLVLALSAAGLVTYVLYPAAPPWLAAKDGVIEPVRRLSGAGWEVLGLPRAGALLADSQGQVNQVAAVPSLHTAFAVLVCLVLLPVARRQWQRLVLLGYGPGMALVLVWSGEHYVVDTLLGAAYAVLVVLVASRARGVVDRLVSRGRQSAPTVDA